MSFISVAPGLGGRQTPAAWKIGLGCWLVLVLGPKFGGSPGSPPLSADVAHFVVMVCREAAVGMLIGFCTNLVLSVAANAGWIIDQSMGIGMVNVIDPQYGTAVPLMGNYLMLLGLVLWLGSNGHHLLLVGLDESFKVLPPGVWPTLDMDGVLKVCVTITASAMGMGFSLAIPALGASLIVDVWLGLLSRSFPQLNAFVIGLPLKMLAVLGTLAASVQVLSTLGSWITAEMVRALRLLFAAALKGA